jgi:pimeloyl-ACP methyl ester carboxylesterase
MASPTEPTIALDLSAVDAADPSAQPQGFVVEVKPGDRIHFLDWDAPVAHRPAGVLLVHGLSQTAWTWTPVGRRLASRLHVVAMDLRGHGLSDSPATGYEPDTLAEDLVAVAEGSGLLAADGGAGVEGVVLAGHGFGAVVAAWGAARLGGAVRGLLLVDGGWQDIARSSGLDPDEFLRGLDEPPEVLRTMEAFLADRRDFDPATWDADQEQAARATVVEQHSKRLTPATRPHALAGCVEAMFKYDPIAVLPSLAAPIVALAAGDDDEATGAAALHAAGQAVAAAGRGPIRVAHFPDTGHNLMRYRPREVGAAVLALASTIGP